MNLSIENIGLDLAAVGTLISIIGVLENNVALDHTLAMWIWLVSNTIFVIYFFGRTRDWWDGHISDGLLCVNYAVMLVSGVWGLMHV